MINLHPYTLPDFNIFNIEWPDYRFFTWQPDKIYIVTGTSNKADVSLLIENVLQDHIEVFKRPSGGESVILTPNTLVLSTVIKDNKFSKPGIYFEAANNLIIKALDNLGVKNLAHKGISDIAINNKKILGSSIYRRQNKVFYHAVLNVAESTGLMERYLKHPSREPDYRTGRRHADFVTSIQSEGYDISPDEIQIMIQDLSE